MILFNYFFNLLFILTIVGLFYLIKNGQLPHRNIISIMLMLGAFFSTLLSAFIFAAEPRYRIPYDGFMIILFSYVAVRVHQNRVKEIYHPQI